jgi:RNA recognition motif-containing protein
MSKKLFVANFPDDVNADDLEKLFNKYGKRSSASIARHQRTGDSLGWAFVEMEDDYEAELAIASLNGSEWRGQRLRVNEARPRKARERDVFGRA